MKLRNYQSRAVAGIAREWKAGHRAVLCVVPTGGGKTVIAEHMIADARARGERVLFVVHTVEDRTEFGAGRPYRIDRYEKII